MASQPAELYKPLTKRATAFYDALAAHLTLRYDKFRWHLNSRPDTGTRITARVKANPLAPTAWHPFRDGGYIQVNWSGDEYTSLSVFLHSVTPVGADNTRTFNLSDPPHLVSNFIEALGTDPRGSARENVKW